MRRLPIALALAALAALGLSQALAAARHQVHLPAVACAGCTGASPTVPPAPTVPPTPAPDPAEYAARMVELVNQARVAAGCPAATANDALMRGAQAWSETMASTGNYRHSGGGYYEHYGYPWGYQENIDGGAETPEFAFEDWMSSAPHKGNLEFCYPISDPSYTTARIYEIGVGYDRFYWTLVVGWRIP